MWWHTIQNGQDVIFRTADPLPGLLSQWADGGPSLFPGITPGIDPARSVY
jgi:hypothetical protein